MFIRVARPMSGHVDGVDLSRFQAGRVYRLRPEHAAFVIAIGAGEPVESDLEPASGMFQGLFPREPRARYMGQERRTLPRH